MTTTVREFLPDSASETDLADYYRLISEVFKADRPEDPPPSFDDVVGSLRTALTGRGPNLRWVARDEEHLTGMANVALPEADNPHLAILDIRVDPEMRRRGIGVALLRATLPSIVANGRSMVAAWGVTEGGPGDKWAHALGFRVVLRNVFQTLDFMSADHELWELSPPPGYQLVRWIGVTPSELLESYAAARSAIHDAPGQETDSARVPMWSPEKVRQAERNLSNRSVEQRVVVAVHEPTGEVAGLTELEIYPHMPSFGVQQDTAVLANHRGRGLGRCVKANMLRWLANERPALKRIGTSTAAENTYMIRVNHQLGFVSIRTMIRVEKPIDELIEVLRVRGGVVQ